MKYMFYAFAYISVWLSVSMHECECLFFLYNQGNGFLMYEQINFRIVLIGASNFLLHCLFMRYLFIFKYNFDGAFNFYSWAFQVSWFKTENIYILIQYYITNILVRDIILLGNFNSSDQLVRIWKHVKNVSY